MHCFFNLVSRDNTIVDEEGIEIGDMSVLRDQVSEAIRDVLRDERDGPEHWSIEITDASGAVLMNLPLEFGDLVFDLSAGFLASEGTDPC